MVLLLVGATMFGVVHALTKVPIPPPPRLGHRGAARERGHRRNGLFRSTEPVLRFLAGLVSLFSPTALESRLDLELRRADYPLGLTAQEYAALCCFSAVTLGGTALGLALVTGMPPIVAVPGFAFGLILPKLQVQEIIRKRVKEITRGLPHAIEIAALCMGAGADFPGALRLLVGAERGTQETPLRRELSLILDELELGHTRREALLAFSERVQTPAVRDFVAAVVQAEEKGNPLAKVIQIQGRMLNQRRSVAAEEAAARAGVLMIAPLMILLCAILLILMGPFITGAGAL
jgi:tight adherence protein C